MFKTQIVIQTIIKNGDKYLLTKRHQPDIEVMHNKWQFPGGGLEYREKPEETAVREAMEEVGLPIKILKLIPVVNQAQINDWHGVFIAYLCEPEHMNVKINDEATDFGWFTKDEVLKLDLVDQNSAIVKSIMDELEK